MVVKCIVRGCKSEWHPGCNLIFHSFPSNIHERENWLKIISLQRPFFAKAKICNLHFKLTDYEGTGKRLQRGVTPFFKDDLPVLPSHSSLYDLLVEKNQNQVLEGPLTSASTQFFNYPQTKKPRLNSDITEKQDIMVNDFRVGQTVSEKTSNPQPSQGVTDLYRNFQGDDYGDDEDDDDGDRQSNHSLIDDEDETPRQTSATNTQLIHDQIHCDHCNNEVQGFRYKCLQCEDFDLCQACEAAGMHCDHYMLRIPKPRPQTELMAILQTLRAHLPPSADDEQTVPEVHNDAGPSRQKKSDTESVKKTKPNDVTNQTIESNSEPNIDCLTYPIKTEIESEIFVDGSTNFNCYDPLKTEPIPSVTDIPFVVPNTYSIPLSTVPVMPRLQIDPNSLTISSVNINTVRNEPTAVSDPSVRAELNSISVYSHNKTTVKHTSTTIMGSGDSFKPPARKRLKN